MSTMSENTRKVLLFPREPFRRIVNGSRILLDNVSSASVRRI